MFWKTFPRKSPTRFPPAAEKSTTLVRKGDRCPRHRGPARPSPRGALSPCLRHSGGCQEHCACRPLVSGRGSRRLRGPPTPAPGTAAATPLGQDPAVRSRIHPGAGVDTVMWRGMYVALRGGRGQGTRPVTRKTRKSSQRLPGGSPSVPDVKRGREHAGLEPTR